MTTPSAPTTATLPASDDLVAVMLYPERAKPPRNSPYRFATAKESATPKDKAAAKIEMALHGEFLVAGPNFLTREAYDRMCQNPFWDGCVKKKILEVIHQQPELHSGTTADFDETDAYTLIEGSVDEEWLRQSLAKDERSEVKGWLSEKIKEIQEGAKKE